MKTYVFSYVEMSSFIWVRVWDDVQLQQRKLDVCWLMTQSNVGDWLTKSWTRFHTCPQLTTTITCQFLHSLLKYTFNSPFQRDFSDCFMLLLISRRLAADFWLCTQLIDWLIFIRALTNLHAANRTTVTMIKHPKEKIYKIHRKIDSCICLSVCLCFVSKISKNYLTDLHAIHSRHCLYHTMETIGFWHRLHSSWLRTNGPKFAILIQDIS